MPELVDEHGRLDLSAVERLTKEELRAWIYTRLHREDTLVPGGLGREEMPHYLLAQIYPTLDRHTRQDMEDIVKNFVHDMARSKEKEANWNGDAADELLLLAQTVCGDIAVDYLEEMAQGKRFFDSQNEEQPDIHYRLLQSLVAVGWRGTPEFWRGQVRLAPGRYVGVAFDGLALISPNEAISLLTNVEWTDAVEDQIFTSLPNFMEEYKISCIVPLLECYLPAIPERTQAAIRGYMAEESIILSAPKPATLDLEPHKNFFRQRGLSLTPGQCAA